MNGASLRQKLVVTNPQGFHLRPMTAFAETASKFQSRVVVSKAGQQEVNGKSPWELMLLAADQGSELIIDVSGPDAEAAFQSLLQLLAQWSVVELKQQGTPPLPQKGVS